MDVKITRLKNRVMKVVLIIMSVLSTLFLGILFYAVHKDNEVLMIIFFGLSVGSISSVYYNLVSNE